MSLHGKTYQLIWTNGNYIQYLSEGTKQKLIFERAIKRKQFKEGKLLIISKEGIKYKFKTL